MNFCGVQSKDIPEIWDRVSGFIESGLNEGEILLHILKRLRATSCQLYIAYDRAEIIAACVTEIVTLGNRKVFNIISIGGTRMREWLPHLATLEAYAKDQGCIAMRFPEIRTGWRQMLKDYKVTKITLEKVL